MLLDPGFDLNLRPMKYPQWYDMYKAALKNTWSVSEVDFSSDTKDLNTKLTTAERHMINRLIAFFATGDSIVSNNLVLNLYQWINSPEARMYLSRQLFEEAQHIEFYLTLLDTYLPDAEERAKAFQAVDLIPSIARKAQFMDRWMDMIEISHEDDTKRTIIETMICFAACVEGLFFYGAFAYVYFLRSKGLLQGLANGTNWVFRDESMHMSFAFSVLDEIRVQYPEEFSPGVEIVVRIMLSEAVDLEVEFAKDLLGGGVAGLGVEPMRQYLQYVADQRLIRLGYEPEYNVKQPFDFMAHQDVQELANFFERRVTSYQTSVEGSVDLGADF